MIYNGSNDRELVLSLAPRTMEVVAALLDAYTGTGDHPYVVAQVVELRNDLLACAQHAETPNSDLA